MKIIIPHNLRGVDILRRGGYGLIQNRQGVQSFVRRLGRFDYPRFHVYLDEHYINLHLDQKQASYEGYSAHSGEYDGETVEAEGMRLEGLAAEMSAADSEPPQSTASDSENKGFWGKIFG